MKTDNNIGDTANASNTIRMLPDELLAAGVWVFDLDNTLYPASSRLFDQVDWNMTDFVSNLLRLPKDEARLLQKQYFHEFGHHHAGLDDAS